MNRIIICFCLLFFIQNSYSQKFYRSNSVPVKAGGNYLQQPWAGGFNSPLVSTIDLNQDGFKDLFIFDATNNRIETFINNGITGAVSYTFNPVYADTFPPMHDWAFLYDFNCDGKEDIFTFSDIAGSVRVYQNTSSVTGGIQFTLLTDQLLTLLGGTLWTNMPATKETYPTFDDVDRDGDMDMLDWPTSPDASVDYHINQSQQLGFGCDSLIFHQDAPCWGQFTMCLGSNQVCVFNAMCKPAPVWTYFDPSDAAKKDDTLTSMLALDIDGDNDTDLLVGDVGSPNSLAVINGGTNQSALMISQDTVFPAYNIPINKHSFIQHAYLDADNDGKKDLFAAARRENFTENIALYLDSSTATVPGFALSDSIFLQSEMIDLGRFAFPAVFDYNNDGLNDLVVGNEQYKPLWNNTLKTGLALFKNTGTLSHPEFELIDRNFADVNALGFSVGGAAPAFGDLDGDTDADMIIGSEDGMLYYYTNTAPIGGTANFVLTQPNYASIDIGNYSIPQIVDLNLDGLNDLVVGRRSGTINYYQNTGTSTAAVFSSVATIDTLGGIVLTVPPGVTGYAAPFFYNDNGTYHLYVACEKGDVYDYNNINGNLNGTFNLFQTIVSKSEGRNLNIGGGDLNGDNLVDLVVGNFAGGITLYFQNVNTSGLQNYDGVMNDVVIVPNPLSNEFSIDVAGLNDEKIIQINIFDCNGKLAKTFESYKSNSKLNVQYLENGIYIVEVRLSNGIIRKKISVIK